MKGPQQSTADAITFARKVTRTQQNLMTIQAENMKLKQKLKQNNEKLVALRRNVKEGEEEESEMKIYYAQAQGTQDRKRVRVADLETRLKQLKDHKLELQRIGRQQTAEQESAQMILIKYRQLFAETEAEASRSTTRLEEVSRTRLRLEKGLERKQAELVALTRQTQASEESLEAISVILQEGASRPLLN